MDSSLIWMVKGIVIATFIGVSYIILIITSKIIKKGIKVDLYAAVNAFLYFGLIFNLGNIIYMFFQDSTMGTSIYSSLVTPIIILMVIAFRFSKTERII